MSFPASLTMFYLPVKTSTNFLLSDHKGMSDYTKNSSSKNSNLTDKLIQKDKVNIEVNFSNKAYMLIIMTNKDKTYYYSIIKYTNITYILVLHFLEIQD